MENEGQPHMTMAPRLDDISTPSAFMAISTITVDRDLRITHYTPSVQMIIHVTPADLHRPLDQVTHTLHDDHLMHDAAEVMRTTTAITRAVQTRSGQWYMLTLQPYTTFDPQMGGVVLTFVDITERKRQEERDWQRARELERQLRLYDTMLSSLTDYVFSYDRDGRFLYANQSMLELLDITEQALPGKSIRDIMPPSTAVQVLEEIKRVFDTKQTVKSTSFFTPPGGTTRYYEYTLSPSFAFDGKVEFVVVLSRDVTERKNIEIELRENRARLQQAMEAGKIFSWTINPATRHLELSSNTKSVIGFPLLENIDQTFNLIHPDDVQPTLNAINKAIETGGQYESEYRLVNPASGEAFWFHSQGAVTTNTADGLPRFVGITQNITERKQTEEQLREQERRQAFLLALGDRLRGVPNPVAVMATMAEALGRQLAVARVGYGEIDVTQTIVSVERDWTDGTVPSLAGESRPLEVFGSAIIAELRAGRTLRLDDIAANPQSAPYAAGYASIGTRALLVVPLIKDDCLTAILYLHEAQPRHWTDADADLAEAVAERTWATVERARADRALQTANEALRASEARLEMLYAQEQAARAQAEEASRLKDEFLAIVSHELRTPLTSILGYGQLLQSRTRDAAYIARTIDKMMRSATVQAQLIEDLLDISRIVSGKLRIEPQPIDLIAVIGSALDTARPAVEAKGLRLQIDLHPAASTIIGDANRLQQVVWNLLSNATKFTPPNGTIHVRLAPHGRNAQLTVSDTGQGISAAFLPYVFDHFRQAEDTSTRIHGGLGLGLAIVRHLVELHGGTVQVASAGADQGATFTVWLPLANDSEAPVP